MLHTLVRWSPLELLAGVIIWVCIYNYLFRQRIRRVFSRHQCEEPTLQEINDRLALFNNGDSPQEFMGERRANISFRGHMVSVVWGKVGYQRGSPITGLVTWTHSKALFAVATPAEELWICSNTDVFALASQTAEGSVFWVRQLAPLLA